APSAAFKNRNGAGATIVMLGPPETLGIGNKEPGTRKLVPLIRQGQGNGSRDAWLLVRRHPFIRLPSVGSPGSLDPNPCCLLLGACSTPPPPRSRSHQSARTRARGRTPASRTSAAGSGRRPSSPALQCRPPRGRRS